MSEYSQSKEWLDETRGWITLYTILRSSTFFFQENRKPLKYYKVGE